MDVLPDKYFLGQQFPNLAFLVGTRSRCECNYVVAAEAFAPLRQVLPRSSIRKIEKAQ
jgi:hypothetical protein